eukprot:6453735-Prymnesium_polylepis.1
MTLADHERLDLAAGEKVPVVDGAHCIEFELLRILMGIELHDAQCCKHLALTCNARKLLAQAASDEDARLDGQAAKDLDEAVVVDRVEASRASALRWVRDAHPLRLRWVQLVGSGRATLLVACDQQLLHLHACELSNQHRAL